MVRYTVLFPWSIIYVLLQP